MHPEYGMLRGLLHSTWNIHGYYRIVPLQVLCPSCLKLPAHTCTRTHQHLEGHLSFSFLSPLLLLFD